MGFSRNHTTSAQEVKEGIAQGVAHLRTAGAAAARGTKDAAAPRVNLVLTKVGLKKSKPRRWPWVAAAIGAGVAVGGAVGYILYARRSEAIGEALLAEELLEDADRARAREAERSDELVDSAAR
jgi:hypothetical protein